MLPSSHCNFHWDQTDTIDSHNVYPNPYIEWKHQMDVYLQIKNRVKYNTSKHILAGKVIKYYFHGKLNKTDTCSPYKIHHLFFNKTNKKFGL